MTEDDDTLDDLFADSKVVSTPEVARAAQIPEAEVRARAGDLGVARVGASYAWTRDDAEALFDDLDEEPPADAGADGGAEGDDDQEEGEYEDE